MVADSSTTLRLEGEKKCYVCGNTDGFTVEPGVSLREASCPACGASRRNSDLAKVIVWTYTGDSRLSLEDALPLLRDLTVFEAQGEGPIHVRLKELPHYTASEFFDAIPPGECDTLGIRSEDLQRLTFADNTFDLVVTQDVFEHIREPDSAFREIWRVLKPGGYHIFTVPYHEGKKTLRRVEVRNGEDIPIHPSIHYCDPLRGDGALVYTDFGEDIGAIIDSIGFHTDIIHCGRWYDVDDIPLVENETEYENYLRYYKNNDLCRFFTYNSVVFSSKKLNCERCPEMLEWTGERYLPYIDPDICGAEIHYEHLHRYAFASQFVHGKDVLDLASGEGYGSYLLSKSANRVVGVEINRDAVAHARNTYIRCNLEFEEGNILDIPIEGEKLFDVIVCFEALEHIEDHEQLLSEIKRLLKDDGLVIISTPNKYAYSDEPGYNNPFHLRELYFHDFRQLLERYLSNMVFFGQRVSKGSYIRSLYPTETATAIDYALKRDNGSFYFTDETNQPMYFIAVASEEDLSDIVPMRSFCVDASDSILEQKKLQTSTVPTYCYVNTGEGFSEKQKISKIISQTPSETLFHISFDLKNFNDIKSLRWDPVEGRLCSIFFDKIWVEMENGDVHLVEPEKLATNGERISDDEFRFNTIDPWFVVPVEGQINNVVMAGSWLVKDIDETISHLNQEIIQSNMKIQSLQQTITDRDAQVGLLDERVEQLTGEAQSLQRTLADRDAQVASLDEQTRQQATQLMQLSNELASMKQSVVWRLLMKFHNGFVERVLPPSTRRREIYDLGLRGSRILVDEGLRCLWLKAREYYKFRKNAVSRSLCYASSNDIETSHKFCKAMNDDVVDSLVLKYIRGRGICIGTEDTPPRVPRNVNIIHINVDDAKALLGSDLGRSRTSCSSGTAYTGYEPKLSCLDFCMVLDIVEKVDKPQIFLEHCLNSLRVGGVLYLATDDRSSSIIRGFLSSNTDAGRYPQDRTGFVLDSCYQNDYINIVEIAENQKTPQGEAEHVYIIEKTGYLGQIEDLLKTSDALVTQDEFDIDVIIPVYNAYEDLIRCTYSVFKHWDNFRVILINDCSTDARISDLFSKLQAFKSDKLVLLENEENLGFVKTVNRGMKYSKNDVVLLNSDTIVTHGWAEKLRRCAYSNKDIATVTPFTNNGTICSVPSFCEENDIPAGFTIDSFAEFIEKISFGKYPEIPTAVGFCMYIKREALERVGYFDEESFGKGYGEENDFCMRAKSYGYKHVLCDDTFVFHRGEGSFSARKAELCRKNLKTLSQKYPEYLPIVHEYIQSNPLVELHKNIRLRMGTWDPNGHKKKILFLLHTWGGGTEKHVRDLINALQNYIFYVLQVEGARVVLTEVNNGHEIEYVFSMKSPLKQFEFHDTEYETILFDIVDRFKIDLIHIHHLIGHSFDVAAIAKQRKIPLLYTVHDYYSVCPNINLLDCNFKLCLGDNSIEKCDVCLKKSKGLDPGFIKNWLSHFNDIFESCETIVCPSHSVLEILSMYYPGAKGKMAIIEHGSDERGADRAEINESSLKPSRNDLFHIAYIGGLGPNKGRDLFYNLASAKEFEDKVAWSIFGISDLHSEPGYYAKHNVHVYGYYKDFDELRMLVTKEKVDLIILPAIWPETFSYTLSEAWAMGVPVIVSGLGALKERVEKHGGGWVVNGSDLDDFKAKIIEILDSPEDYSEKKRETMGIVLKSVAEMAGEYWCLYTHHIEMTQGSSKNRSATSNYILYRSTRTS